MALPIPSRTTDRLSLISPEDDAIRDDTDAAKDALKTYLSADVPDTGALLLKKDAEPFVFVLRPLSEPESAVVQGMARGATYADGLNSGVVNYSLLRFALCAVKGEGAPDLETERLYSKDVLTEASVEWIPKFTAAWLAAKVSQWSQLDAEKKRPSTS